MRDRLVGADRPVELLSVLGVLDRHLHGTLGDPHVLGSERGDDRGVSARDALGVVGESVSRRAVELEPE